MAAGKNSSPFTLMEWLIMMGVITSTCVSVAAYAFTHFESIDNADKRELRLNDGVRELRENQKLLMEKFGLTYVNVKPTEKP